mmetsp:Transcript_18070/g.50738  ORF Transcript_18070/g.50738 Transcript_18070/m.50738 type:complete len:164 (+) Transcript_18070:388-879(+)
MQMRGTMIGTPHWMAPEAFGSVTAIDVSTYDNKVDVWGVGITAIELATMKPPNSELSSVFDIILAIVNGPPPSLSPECGDVLASFVAAALVKDPSARPDAGTLLIAPIIERGAPAIAPPASEFYCCVSITLVLRDRSPSTATEPLPRDGVCARLAHGSSGVCG